MTAGDRPQLILWYTVGGSDGNVEDRSIGWGIKKHGGQYMSPLHRKMIADIDRAKTLGVDAIPLLHNPYGTLPGESMQFDQRIESFPLPWIRNGMDKMLADLQRRTVETIVYLGKIKGDDDFDRSLLYRLNSSILDIPDGQSIACDAVYGASAADTYIDEIIDLIAAMAHKVYIEPVPRKQDTGFHGYNIIDDEARRRRRDSSKFADAEGAPDSMLAGEQVRFVLRNTAGNPENRIMLARRVLDHGHRLAVEYSDMEWAAEEVLRHAGKRPRRGGFEQ